jgi:hypothetical protein
MIYYNRLRTIAPQQRCLFVIVEVTLKNARDMYLNPLKAALV